MAADRTVIINLLPSHLFASDDPVLVPQEQDLSVVIGMNCEIEHGVRHSLR